MILRTRHLELLERQLANFPVVAILGARQVGKTTLARQVEKNWHGPKHHFDLEDPDDQARLIDASFVLRDLRGLVVLDEIQLRPDIFPLLRVLADRPAHRQNSCCSAALHRSCSNIQPSLWPKGGFSRAGWACAG